ncbi:MAG: zinc-binding dehydrogenase [Cyanobacteria bacterium]|nr:zinc-binding dehydrogenase [Cyanobacteriota bacterium]MDW8202337.1 zinc-binding dehydrogenase [Cyanobacteriota bacterium SKYGB_h_bin112]
MTTKAAVLYALNEPLRLEELTLPALKPGQVLVDIAYSGVCHTQLSEVRGKRGPDRYLPHTLGHEGAGVVRDVGAEVTKVKPGDRVVLSWIKGQGRDVPSTQYQGSQGAINSGAISTFLESAIISENRIIPIPEAMPLREAALLGCAIPTGAGVVLNTLRVTPGSSVAIFGVGGVGLSAVMAASLANAMPIIAIDIFDHKLQQALELGATHTINAKTQDVQTALMDITAGKGVDYAIEAAGRTQTMEGAIAAIRAPGGVAVLAGNLAAGERISLDPFDLIKGKQILGTWGGETNPDRDIPRYANLFQAGKLALEQLITHTYSLDDINRALEDLETGKVGRALIETRTTADFSS